MLPHLASRLFGTPLLINRAKLDVILAALGNRVGIEPPAVDMALPTSRPSAQSAPGIAIIPVHGTLVKRALGLDAASGLMSYAEIGARLDAAVRDPAVRGILLDIDSPGGETGGVFELARAVREAAAVKPIWAVANDSAFSAAYAIAASAQRVIVTETGGVGSIGVIALHVDQSIKDANDGYRYTAITAGSHKNDFSPHEPLQDAARAALQAEVDRLYDIFVEHVAVMRDIAPEAVRATEAALYFGPNAVDSGLADVVMSLDAALGEFSVSLLPQGRSRSPARAQSQVGCASFYKESDMQEASEVIGVDEAAVLVAEARRETAQTAQAIAELCLIAGVPDKAAEFIAAGRTETEVRRLLVEMRAVQQSPEIVSTLDPDKPIAAGKNPLLAAVHDLIGKE